MWNQTKAEWTIGIIPFMRVEKDEREREKQIALVLDVFKPHRDAKRPHLLVGDFNSNSPHQLMDQKVQAETRQAWQDNGGKLPGTLCRRYWMPVTLIRFMPSIPSRPK